MSFFLILGVLLWVVLAFWPAVMAKKKGYSFIIFLILAWFVSWLLTLIVVMFMKDKNQTPEDKADTKAAETALDKEEENYIKNLKK